MKDKYRNGFLLFGVIAIVIMLCTFDMDYTDIWHSLRRAGAWFPAVLLLWLFVYILNTASWYLIIHDEGHCKGLGFWRVFKLSVSGFALNYMTPCGLMGGEPYRIMELTPYIGASKATSSVILYVMMHIFSHFWFWLFSTLLFVLIYPVNLEIGILLFVIACFCMVAIYFFARGYRTGMTLKACTLLTRIPGIRRWARQFVKEKESMLRQIDEQIAMLHRQHRRTFYCSLLLEFFARVLSSLEIYFILRAFSTGISFADSVLILAFSSLFSNLIFFSPMQLGAREGGLALAAEGLHLSGALGVYTGLITRVRELFWIAIGILLIRIGNRK